MDTAGSGAEDIALRINFHTVCGANALTHQLRPHPAIGQRTVILHIEDADVIVGAVIDEKGAFIGGKTEAIGTFEIIHQQRQCVRGKIELVDAAKIKLLRTKLTNPGVDATVGWVSKIDRTIRLHDHIVGAIQFFVPEARGQDFVAAIEIRAAEATGNVLAGEDAPLKIVGIAVGFVAWLAEHGNTILLAPAIQRIPGDIGEREMLLDRMPDRTFGELKIGRKQFKLRIQSDEFRKSRIMHFDIHGVQFGKKMTVTWDSQKTDVQSKNQVNSGTK